MIEMAVGKSEVQERGVHQDMGLFRNLTTGAPEAATLRQTRPFLFSLACSRAVSQGRVEAPELHKLRALQQILGIEPENAWHILKVAILNCVVSPRSTRASIDLPGLFRRACALAWADEQVDERGRNVLTRLGLASGLSAARVEEMIRKHEAQSRPRGTALARAETRAIPRVSPNAPRPVRGSVRGRCVVKVA